MFRLILHVVISLVLSVFYVLFSGYYYSVFAKVISVNEKNLKRLPFDILKVNVWQDVEKGVWFLRLSDTLMIERNDGKNQKLPLAVNVDVLKFDPKFFEFSVYGVDIDNTASKTLVEWIDAFSLTAAINASMYLPDKKTSIGYLRKDTKINNKRKGKKLGAYFVSMPYAQYKGKIPEVSIIYRDDPELALYFDKDETEKSVSAALQKYQVVVQNFKVFDLERTQSKWKGQRRHSIAVIALDIDGQILLMYASVPLTIEEFRDILHKKSFLRIKRAMYTEGGSEAGIAYFRRDTFMWQYTENIMFFLKGTMRLPNIIGVKKR